MSRAIPGPVAATPTHQGETAAGGYCPLIGTATARGRTRRTTTHYGGNAYSQLEISPPGREGRPE